MTINPRCDFCGRRNPPWTFPCKPLHLKAHLDLPEYHDDGEWASCDICKELIEKNQKIELMMRSAMQIGAGTNAEYLWKTRLIDAFLANRTGDAYPDDQLVAE